MRRSALRNRPRRKAATARQPSILILRLDSETLAHDGLTLADQLTIGTQLSTHGLNARVVTVDGTTDSHLTQTLRRLAERRDRFELIVVIGHSNETTIRHASDASCDWSTFAKYLEVFLPRQLALIACSAGGSRTACQLFAALPRLDRIFASPECVNVDLAGLILLAAGASLATKRRKSAVVPGLKAIALFTTGRRLKVWRRRGTPDEQDTLEDVLAWAVRGLNRS